jgi:carboxylesterase
MTDDVMPGGEEFFSSSGPQGVLLLHGFTGTTSTMMDLARRCVDEGYSVAVPRLPGHGTSVEDMMGTRWEDWSSAALAAYDELRRSCESVAVVGLSMGGTLASYVAENRSDVVALVLINPLVKHPGAELSEGVQALLDAEVFTFDSIGSDIKKEGVVETSYAATPLACVKSLFDALEGVNDNLGRITAPSLLLTSTEDHVVTTDNGDELVKRSSGSVERIWLENSYHVATMDNDQELLEAATLKFLAGRFGR